MKKIIAFCLIITCSTVAFSHSGGTDSNGCHKDNSAGGIIHCHYDSPSSGSSSGSGSSADAGAILGALAGVALIALLFRGGSQQVISDPNKNETSKSTTSIPSSQNQKNSPLPTSQQVVN